MMCSFSLSFALSFEEEELLFLSRRGSVFLVVSFDEREERERERENCIGFLIQSISFSDDRSFKGLESIRSLTFYLSFLYNYI